MTARIEGIVVGIDASELSHGLIDWSVAGAEARNIPVRLVHAIDPAPFAEPARLAGGYTWPDVGIDSLRAAADEALHHAELYAASRAPGVEVSTEVHNGSPASVLLRTAGPRDLIAIGSRHLGAVRSALFGSTGAGLLSAAEATFVVVRGERPTAAEPPVVVGVSPSPRSEHVLATAFEHAAALDLPLRALLCWEPFFYAPQRRLRGPNTDAHADAELWLGEALAGWQEIYPGVKVERTLLFDYPTVALVKASVGAALVVVGVGDTRLARSFGSVPAGVLHHSACPVAVVGR